MRHEKTKLINFPCVSECFNTNENEKLEKRKKRHEKCKGKKFSVS